MQGTDQTSATLNLVKIAIQGIQGSFHHEAAQKLFPDTKYTLIHAVNFKGVFDAVNNGNADHGVVAIENNLYGSINEVYRLLERNDVWIHAEIRLRIRQCLIGCQELTVQELRRKGSDVRVLSQSPALAQVELWLDENLPEAVREETHDTAESVRYVAEQKSPDIIAVAGPQTALIFGAHIIAADINDDPDNYTRFVAFQKNKSVVEGANATSLILKTDHSPGALSRALTILAEHKLNLTKLDSHPIPGDKQHYAFYIDLDAAYEAKHTARAIQELVASGCSVVILGSYRRLA